MIKLIACDLDGTLMQNGATKPDDELFPLIDALEEKGILFVAASGRQYACMQKLFAPVKDRIAYICENGALCIYRDKIISETYIERNLGKFMLESIREKENCEILLSGKNVSYLESKDSEYIDLIENVVGNNTCIVPDTTEVTEPFYKISVCNMSGIDDSYDYFQDTFSNVANVVTSGNIWLDMMDQNCNKGNALSILCEYLGISSEECAAFGDHYNDVEMLKFAGHSYAMENAQPGIPKLCKYSCSRVEDTLREMIGG